MDYEGEQNYIKTEVYYLGIDKVVVTSLNSLSRSMVTKYTPPLYKFQLDWLDYSQVIFVINVKNCNLYKR